MCRSELKVDNIMRHHTREIVLHRMRHGNLIFPLYPFDVDNGLLNNCPNVIVEDHIHCWNTMDERLVGIAVTSPLFSDGFADYSFSNIGPVWLSILMPSYVHSMASDFCHDIYSGFIYKPVQFRMNVNRMNVTELSTCTTCMDHTHQHENSKLNFDIRACEHFVHTMCTP